MRLNPAIPISERFQARIAAQSICFHSFNMKEAVAELRPDIKGWRTFGAKLLAEPAVLHEVEKIMNRTDRNASKFIDMNWEILEKFHKAIVSNEPVPKELAEAGLNSNRILAKGYITEKGPVREQTTKFHVEGIGEGMAALVGDATPVPDKSKKVM